MCYHRLAEFLNVIQGSALELNVDPAHPTLDCQRLAHVLALRMALVLGSARISAIRTSSYG